MSRTLIRAALLATIALAPSVEVSAVTFFTEDFTNGSANWRFNTGNSPPLATFAAGGPDNGAYVSHTLTLANADSQLLFRAQTPFNSSNLDYTGHWPNNGVYEVSAWIRHNAPQPLAINARFANAANFPGASYLSTIEVAANEWTKVVFNVTPTSPQNLTYEGTSYAAVLSAVGNMQFGINIPAALKATGPYKFDLDKVTILATVPEPAAGVLATVGLAGLAVASRRRT